MPAPIPPKMDYGEQKSTGKNVCSICGTVYDPGKGDPEHGIPAGTAFEDLPADWKCPVCKQGKAYGFWTPITERPEWILHFSVGRVAEYQEIKR